MNSFGLGQGPLVSWCYVSGHHAGLADCGEYLSQLMECCRLEKDFVCAVC